MIDGSWQVLLGVIISQLVITLPVAGLAIRSWLNTKINQRAIEQKPTHDEVSIVIEKEVKRTLAENGANGTLEH